MCGIAGFIAKDGYDISKEVLSNTLSAMKNRGPDDFGFLSTRNEQSYLGRDVNRHVNGASLLLVHRRLSILDLSDAGWQPMESSDQRYCIVFNGEIYNYLELRCELESLGHQFKSNSDTEVLVAAYAQWGSSAFARFIGMFACAILDREKNEIVLARDPFGIKPLYYSQTNDTISFASTIDVLLDNTSVPRHANPERLFLYLRYGISGHGGETLFKDVKQVPAASYLSIDLDNYVVKDPSTYWQLQCDQTIDISFEEAVAEVRDVFLRNVELHLRSDVPVGAALSGGIDSSAIVGAMRLLKGDSLELHAISYIPDDESVSEERWINAVVEKTQAIPHRVGSKSDGVLQYMQAANHSHEEPIGGAGVYAQHGVFRCAQENGIKVMLDGQGADELLGGYRVYLGARLASLLRRGQLGKAWRFVSNCAALPQCSSLYVGAAAVDHLFPAHWQAPFRRLIGQQIAPSWINASWFQRQGIAPLVVNYNSENDALRHTLLKSLQGVGLAHLLRYEDRNSMAYSIESRVPFLTPQLAQLMLSLPEEYIISPRGETKHVFREAMRDIVPDVVLDRRDKTGFATPKKHWLDMVTPVVEEALDSDVARSVPAFDLVGLRREWQRIKSGEQAFDNRAWRWLNAIRWSQRFNVHYG